MLGSAVCAALMLLAGSAVPASADPDVEPVVTDRAADTVTEPVAAVPPVVPPVDDGRVESTPPATLTSPDNWVLKVSAKNETQRPIAPLTTALSSREYEVGGTFSGSMSGPGESDAPHGTLEVGYQIGCGIDMSTSNGVSLGGTAGINTSLGILGTDVITPAPDGVLPNIGGSLGGAITIGLKPGIINIVPVSKKEFTGADPWVMVQGFRIKIDGCVGQSFIRSYAFLTRSTDMSDAILAWYGTTKVV